MAWKHMGNEGHNLGRRWSPTLRSLYSAVRDILTSHIPNTEIKPNNISGDRNVTKKEGEKILKYKDLTIEIQGMRNVKTNVITVIIGATGTISKSLR
jgi:hypothetical protein